jgi:hypothetical protein
MTTTKEIPIHDCSKTFRSLNQLRCKCTRRVSFQNAHRLVGRNLAVWNQDRTYILLVPRTKTVRFPKPKIALQPKKKFQSFRDRTVTDSDGNQFSVPKKVIDKIGRAAFTDKDTGEIKLAHPSHELNKSLVELDAGVNAGRIIGNGPSVSWGDPERISQALTFYSSSPDLITPDNFNALGNSPYHNIGEGHCRKVQASGFMASADIRHSGHSPEVDVNGDDEDLSDLFPVWSHESNHTPEVIIREYKRSNEQEKVHLSEKELKDFYESCELAGKLATKSIALRLVCACGTIRQTVQQVFADTVTPSSEVGFTCTECMTWKGRRKRQVSKLRYKFESKCKVCNARGCRTCFESDITIKFQRFIPHAAHQNKASKYLAKNRAVPKKIEVPIELLPSTQPQGVLSFNT